MIDRAEASSLAARHPEKERAILVVDDDEDDRMFVKAAMQVVAPTVLVEEAEDGVVALQILHDQARRLPDLVLLDLNMPRKDGLEVLAEIRTDPALRQLVVIAIFTTATDPESVRLAYASGANAYIGKPSSLLGLQAMMAGIVRHWFEIATLPERP